MKKKINYTNEPIKMKRVEDFLPNPENLVLLDIYADKYLDTA